MKLTAEKILDRLTPAERARAERVESVLPALRAAAPDVDRKGEFHLPHVKTLSEAGLLGLVVPETYGGLGGGLRDLCGATFALGSACPSTALSFFFHCSSSSRGLLALEAIEAGLFRENEVGIVRAFAERVLTTMGHDRKWLANFASESVKSEKSAITISTTAAPSSGGFKLNGVKSFGCATGVADRYLVTAALEGSKDASGLCTFMIDRDAKGVRERQKWDAIGMRGTATHGLILEDVFVPHEDSLAIPGAFAKCVQMSRGSFVGNQLAGIAVYAGAASQIFDTAMSDLKRKTFEDTGRPLGTGPFQQQLVGDMALDLETALLWVRRQLELETSEPPLRPKSEVVQHWRLCKGAAAEASYRVAVTALKTAGTSGTGNTEPYARAVRDMSMGLVQAFPAERGRLMVSQALFEGSEQAQFSVRK